ncbi:hypothetical protein D3C75_1247720 [compost metagenome]
MTGEARKHDGIHATFFKGFADLENVELPGSHVGALIQGQQYILEWVLFEQEVIAALIFKHSSGFDQFVEQITASQGTKPAHDTKLSNDRCFTGRR